MEHYVYHISHGSLGVGVKVPKEGRKNHGPRIDYKIQSQRQKRRRKMIEKIIDLFVFYFSFCYNEISRKRKINYSEMQFIDKLLCWKTDY